MSNSEQAQYLVNLPLAQFKAIRKAISILARGGMNREDALKLICEQHQQSHFRTR